MTLERSQEYLRSLLKELISLSGETGWVEFKVNNADPDQLGEYISALANAAAIEGKSNAYLVWGVHDENHEIVGTTFCPDKAKKGNEELESWLLRLLKPRIHFSFFEFTYNEKPVVILEIQSAAHNPVQFQGREWIRIGSNKKPLKDYPEKERELWRVFDQTPFERQIAAENLSSDEILQQLDYPAFFELTGFPLPDHREGILGRLCDEDMIHRENTGNWSITNLGAILFARKLSSFLHLKRKAARVIFYKGNSRIETLQEQEETKGYANGFEGLMGFINNLLPKNEVIGQALRKSVPMYPELALRELVANAIIHQDFTLTGTGPMIEIFDTRMEITNPGTPLVDTQRFLDTPPRSRNEALASFLRRIGICEERGGGIDKVVFQTEYYQLPAPLFEVATEHTRATLFAHRELKAMDKDEKSRACYLHCCLRYVNKEPMNNLSLRERFGIDEKNSAIASRIIKQTMEDALIRPYDSSVNRKNIRYVPFWA
ncbi:MAG: putative DNA binding domain-containing protein [SAR324 cluster bacterium]|nr:putative DNA binding domain-containing protein [SAR324 cluster bacterium]